MSGNSVVGQAWNIVSSPFKSAPQANLTTPPAQPLASQAATSEAMQQKELQSEQQQSTTGTVLTSGAGLLDEPTTTSRVLLGS